MTDKLTRTIKAISVKTKAEGKIGFLTNEEDKWYNISADEPALDEMLKTVIQKGNKVEFELDMGIPSNFTVLEKGKEKNWADDMTNFEDLLTAAHEKFNSLQIKTEMLQVDFEKKTAVFKARVDGNGCWFEGHGDACGITNDKIQPHFMRMAETRAIARALRWATNNAKVAAEETEEGGEEPNSDEMSKP